MALPTKTNILTGEYSSDGSPFIQVTSKAGIDPNTLEYSSDGSPWWSIAETSVASLIKKVGSVSWAAIKKIGGVLRANIKKISGTSS